MSSASMSGPWPIRALLAVVVLLAAGASADDGHPEDGAPLRVGQVSIVLTDIYSEEELATTSGLVGFVHRAMNTVHPGTRTRIIRRELLMREGDLLDPDILAETERNLRAAGYLTNVSVVPVDTLADGSVPIEVRCQETWSLTSSFNYAKSSSATRWSARLSDRNFLGYGLQLGAGVGHDEDRDWVQFDLQNRRFLGTPYRLTLVHTDLSDGHVREAEVRLPFNARDDAWSGHVQAWSRRFALRWYLEPSALGDAPSAERLYAAPTLDFEGMSVGLVRRVSPAGRGRLWRLGAQLRSEAMTPDLDHDLELSDDRVLTPEAFRDVAGAGLYRREGRTVRAELVLETLGRAWATDRYIERYGAEEDLPVDPWARLEVGRNLCTLGGGHGGSGFKLQAADWSRLAGGWLSTRLIAQGELGDERRDWHIVDGIVGWLHHAGSGLTRIFVEGVHADEVTGTAVPVLGLTRGLRTLEYDGLVGERLARWTVEHARLVPGEVLGFYRVAVAGFYAGGSAWWSDAAAASRRTRHELGVGLRFGPTRSASAEVARLDVAWNLDGSGGPEITAATGGYF